jgi:hypothetical protein
VNREVKEHIQIELSIQAQRRPVVDMRPGRPTSETQLATILVAIAKKVVRLKGQTDAMKIEDDGIARVLCLRNKGTDSALQLYAPWSPETVYTVALDRLRIFSPFDVAAPSASSPRTVGKQRTLLETRPLVQILHPGPCGTISLRDIDDKTHRVQIQLAPRNELMIRLLKLILFVLPSWLGDFLLCIWWNRHQSNDGGLLKEWHAFVLALFSIAVSMDESVGGRRRSEVPAPRSSPSKTRKVSAISLSAFSRMIQAEADWDNQNVMAQSGWSGAAKDIAVSEHQTSSIGVLIAEAREFVRSKTGQEVSAPLRANPELVRLALSRTIASLHLYGEEIKLDSGQESHENLVSKNFNLPPVIAQLARWMDWTAWDWKPGRYYSVQCSAESGFEDGKQTCYICLDLISIGQLSRAK